MSISSELLDLYNNKAAIKAAIEAKNPTVAPTDALAQWPTSIASIPSGGGDSGNELEPYPWVGSGTHAWVHYDSSSISHLCQLNFKYTGSVTLDWGDGSPVVSLSSATKTSTTQSHTYTDGDFRIDISGTLHFGSYTYSGGTFTYEDNFGTSFMSNDIGFGTNYANSIYAREALVQFETDAPMFIGSGNAGYVQIGSTANLRWMKFTEATVIGLNPFYQALGLIGLYAPKCERMFYFQDIVFSSLRILDIPSVSSFYDDSDARPGNWFNNRVQSLQEFSCNASVLPQNFLFAAVSLLKASFPNISGVVNGLLAGGCMSLREIEIPEGVTELAGEVGRNCISLNRLVFPSSLVSISNALAFYAIYSLNTLICRATTPPALASNNNLIGPVSNPGFAVWVPQGTVSTYEATTNWAKFAGKFHELDADGNIPS